MGQRNDENIMGTGRVPAVLLKMGIPIIVSMVLQAMYNIVDSMFVSRMSDLPNLEHTGEYAVNALTLAFPIQMLIVAFGIGTGVGMGAMLSRLLGMKDAEGVAKTAGNGVFLGIVISAAFVAFGLFGIDPYLKSQTTDPVIFSMGRSYLRICTFLCLGNVLWGVYEKRQFVSLFLAMFFQYKLNREIKSGFRYLKPDFHIISGIYSIGFSAIVMQALMSFMTYGINIIFVRVSVNAVTAYGISYKIQQFIYFAGFGIRDAITPLISYNYGRNSRKRVREGEKYGLIYTIVIMLAGMAALNLFAYPLSGIFGLSAGTQELCVRAMHIISVGFVFAGINIAVQGIFQALEAGTGSLIISVLRLLAVPLPLAYLLSLSADASTIIWWSIPAGEIAAAAVAVFMLRKVNRRVGITQ